MISLYRSPLQTPDQFDKFLSHLSIYYKAFLDLRVPLFWLRVTLTVEISVGPLEILQVHQQPVFEALKSFYNN